MNSGKDRAAIFISWSGDMSKQVAQALRELLKGAIQTANPWLSDPDIERGARWRTEIEAALEGALAGLIVLTPENLNSPWLLFEAGALSKKNDRVYTYLFNLKKSQVKDPLAQFQATSSCKDETLEMLKSINRKLDEMGVGVEEARLVRAFHHNWEEFDSALKGIPCSPIPKLAPPDPTELLPELVGYLRAQSADLADLKQAVNGLVVSSQVMKQLFPFATAPGLLGQPIDPYLLGQQLLAASAHAGSSSLPGPQSPARRTLAGDRPEEQPPLMPTPLRSPKKPTR
jgi:hypothetical protein